MKDDKMNNFYAEFSALLGYGRNLALLLPRWVVAFAFLGPLSMKIGNLPETGIWFGELGIPFPHFFAYLVTGVEAIGIVLLAAGLMTRMVSAVLSIIMIVAILTVHLHHGFSAASRGFELPLYYLLFFFILMTFGAGKYSLDHLLFSRKKI
jgi:putative oxidoreductase